MHTWHETAILLYLYQVIYSCFVSLSSIFQLTSMISIHTDPAFMFLMQKLIRYNACTEEESEGKAKPIKKEKKQASMFLFSALLRTYIIKAGIKCFCYNLLLKLVMSFKFAKGSIRCRHMKLQKNFT